MGTIVKKHSTDNDDPNLEPDRQLQAFFDADIDQQSQETDRLRTAISRTRFNVAQKDAVSFSFIKIWTTIAEMLAPLFANFAAKKYSPERRHKHNKPAKHNKHRKYNRRKTDK